ncbi:Na+/H+ antiporter NhaC [Caldalkalibacillus thermarum]|uniref:Na+/H+ antiporter NhaC n=1 Tax=Caldalkalibacillus thermarum TaxID=296745 RepID=UPI00166BE2FB|nr:Na+/H+ antiporter NhaC [Caldalkalibacillus thermarum]GGK18071.1 Na+/H+ antiporter NhaC [Caldalkalibacillus thermarum]
METKITGFKITLLITTCFIIVLGGVIFIKAPTTIVLITAGMLAIALALLWGISWDELFHDILNSLQAMMPAILILIAVGMLVGVWILSGIIPIIVYYGLLILNPTIFLVAVAIVCAFMSTVTGTSWGCISTLGVALIGVSIGLDVPVELTAGAIVTGAIFGDKLSPLSDTTVMASAVSDVNIVDHIKYLLYTTLPAFLLSLVLYSVLGIGNQGQTVQGEGNVGVILHTLETNFDLNPLLFLIPFIVLYFIYKQKPVLLVFGIGILFGAVAAVIFQGQGILAIAHSLQNGFTNTTGVQVVDEMLMRGGLSNMLGTVALLIAAAIFGSPFRTMGVIDFALEKIRAIATQGRTIMLYGFSLHGFMFMLTGSYYVTFAVLGPMLKSLYDRYGLHRKNLSRTLEDTGTNLAPIIPWSVTGAFIAGTLGVPTVDYILYAPLTYLGLVFALFYIITGYKIARTNHLQVVNQQKDTTV